MEADKQKLKEERKKAEDGKMNLETNLFRLGCDIGGTFTDFVLVNSTTGEF